MDNGTWILKFKYHLEAQVVILVPSKSVTSRGLSNGFNLLTAV